MPNALFLATAASDVREAVYLVIFMGTGLLLLFSIVAFAVPDIRHFIVRHRKALLSLAGVLAAAAVLLILIVTLAMSA